MPGRVRSAGPTIVDVQPWRRVPVRDLTEETALQRLIVVFQHRRQVIGSVYARKLLGAGHDVVLLARGRRLADLEAFGLILEEAGSGQRTVLPVTAVSAPGADDRFDLVLVPVRSEQLASTLPALSSMRDGSDVLFLGNTAGRQAQLVEALGSRVLFGFPAAGGPVAVPSSATS